MPGGSFAWRRLTEYHDEGRDQFDIPYRNEPYDLINVPGEHDFTPERLRYYKDGTRIFLEYGTDPNYSETTTGHLLEPDAGQTLTLNFAERTAYPVGKDVWPSMARRLTQAPQAGDVVAGGYGVPDLANFDPATISYTGTEADGWFWYHTADTGLDECILAGVKDGTIFYDTRVDLYKTADIISIMEQRINWYSVGGAEFRQSFTNIADRPEKPQQNETIGAVANDDGKSAARGSHRVTMSIHQAAGNTGLGLEAGSMKISASGQPSYQFKQKGHSMDLENTNTTRGTYQVCAAIRGDPARPTVKLRIPEFDIISTPGSAVNWTRVLMIAVGDVETSASGATYAPPPEHNPANSIVREVEDNTLTGPVEDDANTDASGPVTANTMTNPGGWQLGRESVTPEGTGSKTSITTGEQVGNRPLYDTDIALVLVDSDTAGTVEIDVQTSQNS